jgi:hypothetical protein
MTKEQAERHGNAVIASLREDGYTEEQVKALLEAALKQIEHKLIEKITMSKQEYDELNACAELLYLIERDHEVLDAYDLALAKAARFTLDGGLYQDDVEDLPFLPPPEKSDDHRR